EIDRMQREAELHAEEDRRKRDVIEVKNTADSAAYQAERTLRDNADKIDASLKAEVEERVKDVRDALQSEDADRMRGALDALTTSMQRIGEAVYGAQAQAGAAPGADSDAGQGPAGEGTVEGEFREV
ncbi:MAG: Hsp70 family protein, partial [Dehalococcoidia bacterium]|nr:Hsp70 family protein [Dehalococcoidia bacterium]